MSVEPPDKPESAASPTPLVYATHVGQYPQLQDHPRYVVILIALAGLAGVWSIILGVFSLSDLWFFGLLLIGAGICLCWGTVGKLSSKGMRLRAAMLLLISSIAIYTPVIVISHMQYTQERNRNARALEMEQSDWRHTPTEAEQEVFTYKMIRDNAVVSRYWASPAACTPLPG
jgi:hypothetical protein